MVKEKPWSSHQRQTGQNFAGKPQPRDNIQFKGDGLVYDIRVSFWLNSIANNIVSVWLFWV